MWMLWIGSILISIIIDRSTARKMDDFFYDNGFVPNFCETSHDLQMKSERLFQSILTLLPGVNILIAAERRFVWEEQKETILEIYKEEQWLKPIDEEEIEKEDILSQIMNQDMRDCVLLMRYQDEQLDGEILYGIQNGFPSIVSSTGSLAKLSRLEQHALIRNSYHEVRQLINETLGYDLQRMLDTDDLINTVEDLLDQEKVMVMDTNIMKEVLTNYLANYPMQEVEEKPKVLTKHK